MRSRQMLFAALAALAAIAIAAFVVTFSAPPRYTSAGDGLALGPSVQHAHASTDVIVQIATGALTTAAGNAGAGLPTLGENAPTPQEQALLDLTNADRAQNGLGQLTFDPVALQVARVRAAAQIPDGPLSHYNS